MQTVCANSNLHYSLFCISSSAFAIICLYCSFTLSGASICTLPFPPKGYCFILIWYYTMNNLFFSRYEDSFATSIRQGVTVHSVHSNALRDAQKSCIRMISRRNSRVFCELCSQKTPRGTLPVNSNVKVSLFDNTWYYIFEDKKKRGRSTSIIHSIINIQCNHRYDLFNRRLFSVRCNCFPKSHRFRFSTFHCFPNSKLHFRS